MERLQNLRHKADAMVERAKIAYERRCSSLWAKSIEDFLSIADTSEGSLVTVFPGVRELGHHYDRPRTVDEF